MGTVARWGLWIEVGLVVSLVDMQAVKLDIERDVLRE